jgi:hypothetical protein
MIRKSGYRFSEKIMLKDKLPLDYHIARRNPCKLAKLRYAELNIPRAAMARIEFLPIGGASCLACR